jgi:hypothetical protein
MIHRRHHQTTRKSWSAGRTATHPGAYWHQGNAQRSRRRCEASAFEGEPFLGGRWRGLALAVHPADDNLNRSLVNSDVAGRIFKPGELLGQLPTLLATAGTIYFVGRVSDEPKVSHVGMDLIDSLVISEGITQPLKRATRRERPDRSGRTSFPSGHAADTFAFATARERHLGWRRRTRIYAFVVRRYLARACQSSLIQRRGVWFGCGHHRREDSYTARAGLSDRARGWPRGCGDRLHASSRMRQDDRWACGTSSTRRCLQGDASPRRRSESDRRSDC